MSHKKIKNIIFDLGGVIINLDVPKTFKSFARLGGISERQIMGMVESSPFFDDYEKGLISSVTFRKCIPEIVEEEFVGRGN